MGAFKRARSQLNSHISPEAKQQNLSHKIAKVLKCFIHDFYGKLSCVHTHTHKHTHIHTHTNTHILTYTHIHTHSHIHTHTHTHTHIDLLLSYVKV